MPSPSELARAQSGKVIPFPVSAMSRVDRMCRLIAEGKGPRELIETEAHPGAVCVKLDGFELWVSPDEARALADDFLEMAADAEAREVSR